MTTPSTPPKEPRRYDLAERTFLFAQSVKALCAGTVKKKANEIEIHQLLRSSSSIGANYIEADEALSDKDFVMRIKICRKESKESMYWLRLLDLSVDVAWEQRRLVLGGEARQLMLIFNAIVQKMERKKH